MKNNKAITLIALIITVIILLIVAGITIMYINGTGTKTENTVWTQDKTENTVWTQDKTSVTNGSITLEVGQEVSGYTANGVGDGNWYVLGAEDGKLLITTNSNQGEVKLSGKDGYTNGVSKLNAEGAKFKDTTMADSARSINAEDINRVTGFIPGVTKFNDSRSAIMQFGNKVTYSLNPDGKIHYQGTIYPTTAEVLGETDFVLTYWNGKSSFTYWNGSNWITLEDAPGKNSVTITNDYYNYSMTTATPSSAICEIKVSDKAETLLCADTNEIGYWLAEQYVLPGEGIAEFGIRSLGCGAVGGAFLFGSDGSVHGILEPDFRTDYCENGLRPVVSLKSNIKVTSDGVLSI